MNTPGYAYFHQLELKKYPGPLPQKVAEQGSNARCSTENASRKGLPGGKITGVTQSSLTPDGKSWGPVSHSVASATAKPLTQKQRLAINEIESQLNLSCKELDVYLSKNKEEVDYTSGKGSHFLDEIEEIYRKLSDNDFDFYTLDEFNTMDPKVKYVIRSYNAFTKRINDSSPFNGLMIYDEFLLPQKEIHSGVESIPAGHSLFNGRQLKQGYIRANRSSSFGTVKSESMIPRNFKEANHPSFIEKDSGPWALSMCSSSSDAENSGPESSAHLTSAEKTARNIYDERAKSTIIYKMPNSNKLNDGKKTHAVGHDIDSDSAVGDSCSERGDISGPVIAAWERVLSSKGKSNRGKIHKLKTVTIYVIARKEKDRRGIDRKQVLERIGPKLYKLKYEYDRFENDFHTFFTSRDYRLHKDAPEFVMMKEKLDTLRIKLKKLKQSHLGYDETRLQKHLLGSLRRLSDELDTVSENAIKSNMLRL